MNPSDARAGVLRFSLAFLLTVFLVICACFAWYRWTRDNDALAYDAVASGNVETVERLVATRPALLAENKHYTQTAMVMAALRRPDVLQLIAPVIHDAASDKSKLWNALSMAAQKDGIQSVRVLLESGWDPNEGATYSLLLEACKEQDSDLIEALLRHNADPTPAFAWACDQEDIEFASRLLSLGADPSAARALANAVRNGKWRLVDQLRAKGANAADGLIGVTDATPRDLISSLVEHVDFDLDVDLQSELLRNLYGMEDSAILKSVLPQLKVANGNEPPRPIIDLVECGSARKPLEKLEVLLRHGVNVNAVASSQKGTALHILAAKSMFSDDIRVAMVQRLVDVGADLNLKIYSRQTHHFDTPLFVCLGAHNSSGPTDAQLEIAKVLIRAGAGRATDEDGCNYLYLAASRWVPANENQLELVKLLIDAGVEVNARGLGGATPLHATCDEGQVEIAKMLLAAGADPDIKSESGETPLQRCERAIESANRNRLIETAQHLSKLAKLLTDAKSTVSL